VFRCRSMLDGDTTLTQFRAWCTFVEQSDTSEAVTLADNGGGVGVTVTVTDKDGDSSHATVNLNAW